MKIKDGRGNVCLKIRYGNIFTVKSRLIGDCLSKSQLTSNTGFNYSISKTHSKNFMSSKKFIILFLIYLIFLVSIYWFVQDSSCQDPYIYPLKILTAVLLFALLVIFPLLAYLSSPPIIQYLTKIGPLTALCLVILVTGFVLSSLLQEYEKVLEISRSLPVKKDSCNATKSVLKTNWKKGL